MGGTGSISVSSFRWGPEEMESVTGNEQVSVILQGPEDWKGICYGVVESKETIPLHGVNQGIFIHFSPGSFSDIFHIPAKLIDPYGMPLEDIFSADPVTLMKDTMASPTPQRALLELFGGWAEGKLPSQECQLAKQVAPLIREKQGHVRVRELENETAYFLTPPSGCDNLADRDCTQTDVSPGPVPKCAAHYADQSEHKPVLFGPDAGIQRPGPFQQGI